MSCITMATLSAASFPVYCSFFPLKRVREGTGRDRTGRRETLRRKLLYVIKKNFHQPSFSRSFPQQLVVNFGNDASVFIDVIRKAKFLCHCFSIFSKVKPVMCIKILRSLPSSESLNFTYGKTWLVPSRLRVTRAAGAGIDGKGSLSPSLSSFPTHSSRH